MDNNHASGGHKANSISGHGSGTPVNESQDGQEEFRSAGGGPGRVAEWELRVSPADIAIPLNAPSSMGLGPGQ